MASFGSEMAMSVMESDPMTAVEIGSLILKRYNIQVPRRDIISTMNKLVEEGKVSVSGDLIHLWSTSPRSKEISITGYTDIPMVFVDLGNCNTDINKLEKLAEEEQIKLFKFIDPCYTGPGLHSVGPMDFVFQVPICSKGFRDSADVELIMHVQEMITRGEILSSTTVIIVSKDKIMDYLGEKLRRDKLADVNIITKIGKELFALL